MLSRKFRPQAALPLRVPGLRWRSSIHAGQNGRFSILTQASVSKRQVLDHLTSNDLGTPPSFSQGVSARKSNAAVVLASQELASWLEDVGFMSTLLQSFSFEHESESRDIHVLGAVVDGLCPPHPHGSPVSGFSVLHGQLDAILPGLWDSGGSSRRLAVDTPASVSVALSPLLGDFRSLNVTVPMANTVFQNGRQSTLLASRWRSHGSGGYELAHMVEKETQAIVPSLRSIQTHTSVSVPLFPVTAPRKILAGLGNIVRQVEADGKPSAASRELEANIPRLLEARKRSSQELTTGPIGVWALIIPPEAAGSGLVDAVDLDKGYDATSEQDVADSAGRSFSSLLAAGCRLHKILSGGGGWGLKQGLLSLDPQTRYSNQGDGDMESFISSFKGEATPGGIATPGSYIQFFVEPISCETTTTILGDAAKLQHCSLPSLAFGSHQNAAESRPRAGEEPVSVIDHHFGAVSSRGLFVDLIAQPDSEVDGRKSAHTKIDAPYSYIWGGARRWL